MPPEGIEIVQRLHLRENSGSMEFAETKEVSRQSPRELKFVCYIIRLEDLTKSFKIMTSLCDVWWCSNTIACPAPSPRQRKATLERHPLSQKKLFNSASTVLRLNRTKQILRWKLNRWKQILRWDHQANELQLPPSLKPVKVLSQMTPT